MVSLSWVTAHVCSHRICMIAGIAHLPLNLITSWGPRAPGFTGLHLLPMWGHSMVDVTVHACYAACFFLNEDQGV